jgi:hypothetical protein
MPQRLQDSVYVVSVFRASPGIVTNWKSHSLSPEMAPLAMYCCNT